MIYEKLMRIQSELKAPKTNENRFGGYKYRSCEDILEAVKCLLREHRCALTITDNIRETSGRVYVVATATLYDVDTGERVETTAFAREPEDKKGMDLSQITGSASSYARKYALNGLFSIDDTADPDATNTHGKEEQPARKTSAAKQPARKPAAPVAQEAPAAPAAQVTAEDIDNYASYLAHMIEKYADNKLGEQILKLYGVKALKDLTPAQIHDAACKVKAYDHKKREEKHE